MEETSFNTLSNAENLDIEMINYSDGNKQKENSKHDEEYSEAKSETDLSETLIPQADKVTVKGEGAFCCQKVKPTHFLWVLFVLVALLFGASLLYISKGMDSSVDENIQNNQFMPIAGTYRIAFGSCTSRDQRPQPIWSAAVIPSAPDAWVWAGDMAYLDTNEANCNVEPARSSPACNCNFTWYRTDQSICGAGDIDLAVRKWQKQVRHPGYLEFLKYMCPLAAEQGLIPPPGSDPLFCPRPIIGTWDDHDYGANNANRRFPQKYMFKQLFLDAIGESPLSPRRNLLRGLYWKHTLNNGQIDVFLLDERYERDPLPCYISRKYCETAILPQENHRRKAWCEDFLYGGDYGGGSCCKKDEEIFFGWCTDPKNKHNDLWPQACDPSHEDFAMQSLIIKNGTLVKPDGSEYYDMYQESPMCEVLGKEQRVWLHNALQSSYAPLKIIVSGSVVLGNGNPENNTVAGPCSYDDFDCYRPAQLQLLHEIGATPGCTIILTGDFHISDIKVLKPGKALYSKAYGSENNKYPIYQVMASGMTDSTAVPVDCSSWRLDPTGLRDHEECGFVTGPSFGMIEIENKKTTNVQGSGDISLLDISLIIKSGKTGETLLKSMLDSKHCPPLNRS